jgi:hypothetical protein
MARCRLPILFFLVMLLAAACRTAVAPRAGPALPAPQSPSPTPAANAEEVASGGKDAAVAEGTRVAPCDWRIEKGKLVSPSRESRDLEGNITEVDLDGKAPLDRIVNVGSCGSWGDCEFVVLQAWGNGTYRAVWGPEYTQLIEVGERPRGAELANLVLHDRTAQPGCDLPLKTVLRWTGKEWEKGETCAGQGVWDDAACGQRPPACK